MIDGDVISATDEVPTLHLTSIAIEDGWHGIEKDWPTRVN
jgi:hypothetical protein